MVWGKQRRRVVANMERPLRRARPAIHKVEGRDYASVVHRKRFAHRDLLGKVLPRFLAKLLQRGISADGSGISESSDAKSTHCGFSRIVAMISECVLALVVHVFGPFFGKRYKSFLGVGVVAVLMPP